MCQYFWSYSTTSQCPKYNFLYIFAFFSVISLEKEKKSQLYKRINTEGKTSDYKELETIEVKQNRELNNESKPMSVQTFLSPPENYQLPRHFSRLLKHSDCITNFVKISCFWWKFIWWGQFLSHRNPQIFIKVKYLQYQLEILTKSEKWKCLLPSYTKNIDGSIDYWSVQKPRGQYRKYCQLKKLTLTKLMVMMWKAFAFWNFGKSVSKPGRASSSKSTCA